jgi:hypothetical protein
LINPKNYDDLIKSFLDFYNLADIELVYIEQVPGSNSPFSPASTSPDPKTRRQKIYIAQPMTDEIISGGKSNCLESIAQLLTTDELFLKHTILHEIRHIQHRHDCRGKSDCEKDCDAWAYEQLRIRGELE